MVHSRKATVYMRRWLAEELEAAPFHGSDVTLLKPVANESKLLETAVSWVGSVLIALWSHFIADVPECSAASPICRHGGTCTELIGSYRCACTADYFGVNCEQGQRKCALSFFMPTLDTTLILVSFSDECFRNILEWKSFKFQRHRISHFENTDMFPCGNIGGLY